MKSETAAWPVLPLLPLRDVVVFPHMVIPLFVGREKSIAALESAMDDEKRILLVAQRQHRQAVWREGGVGGRRFDRHVRILRRPGQAMAAAQ